MTVATVTALEDYRTQRASRPFPLADPNLPHQVKLVCRRGGGAGITVTCNCGASLDRNLEQGEDAMPHYKAHLAGAW